MAVIENKSIRLIVRIALALIMLYAFVSRSGDIRSNVSKRDFIAYWAAGQLLIHHHNPYAAGPVLELEKPQGFTENKALILRTPPWSLFIMLPLGLVNAYWGWLLWLAISITSLVLSMRLCWRMFGHDSTNRSLFWVIGYTFAPVLACLVAAQMGILLLLGIVLFLSFESDRPFIAGAALILPFSKPHLLTLFWLALLFWIITRKKWVVAAGFAGALFAVTVIALAFDPAVFQHYREMLSAASIGSEFIPAFTGVLRLIFFHRLFWVQFIPMVIGLVWCVWYYFVNRSTWDWRDHGAAVMVVSMLTPPYSWFTDEVVLLPAILQAFLFAYARGTTLGNRLVTFTFACLNGLLVVMVIFKVPMPSGMYFWSSLVWFLLFCYSRRRKQALQSAASG